MLMTGDILIFGRCSTGADGQIPETPEYHPAGSNRQRETLALISGSRGI
jgi:hypothetical protein